MSALETYKNKKKLDGNGPKTGADKDDVNSTTQILKRQGLKDDIDSDYFKKRKGKQKETGIL